MTQKTLTRANLAETVYQKVGMSRSESVSLVGDVLEEICKAAERHETIKLSSFGTFIVRSKKERIGRNPKTGEEAPISARHVMVFHPSSIMKTKVNQEHLNRNSDD